MVTQYEALRRCWYWMGLLRQGVGTTNGIPHGFTLYGSKHYADQLIADYEAVAEFIDKKPNG